MSRTPSMAALAGGLVAWVGLLPATPTGVPARVAREPGPWIALAAGTFTMGSEPGIPARLRTACLRELMRLPGSTARLRLAEACQDAAFQDEVGAHPVWLPAFAIDRTEVTVSAYARCVAAGACPRSGVVPGTPLLGGPTQPAVDLTWDAAGAYCRHVHGRLPTEAEWERAARGVGARPYPWGWHPDPRRANHGALAWPYRPDDGSEPDGHAVAAPVGSYPEGASPDGVLDLAGNAAEWVADAWDPVGSVYPRTLQVAPTGASHGAERLVRGGSWRDPLFRLRTTARDHRPAGDHLEYLGFRCAYDLP